MAVEADVDIVPVDPFDVQPVDELLRRLVLQRLHHPAPRRHLHRAAMLQRADHRFKALPHGRLEDARVLVEFGGKA